MSMMINGPWKQAGTFRFIPRINKFERHISCYWLNTYTSIWW